VSALTGDGVETLRGHLGPGVTTAFVGSSGVGKSSLINRLLGRDVQSVLTLDSDGKGRHATTRRELFELPGNGMLIDTPGLRELGIIEDAGGILASFPDVAALAERCRFRDCRHEREPGCAVVEAVAAGDLDADRLAGYQKLQREVASVERRTDPLLAARPKREWKSISKAIREMYRIDPRKKR
jgi:ribosome biogenesis GTPase